MRHFLIDTDTASDDPVGLVMALTHPEVQVEAITVVAGNVPVDQGVQNALYTVELMGAGTPVYRGRERPLLRPLQTAQDVHGQDGMGDIGLPLAGRIPAWGHAVDVLVETIDRHAADALFWWTLHPLHEHGYVGQHWLALSRAGRHHRHSVTSAGLGYGRTRCVASRGWGTAPMRFRTGAG
jgi:hypothetical protein